MRGESSGAGLAAGAMGQRFGSTVSKLARVQAAVHVRTLHTSHIHMRFCIHMMLSRIMCV